MKKTYSISLDEDLMNKFIELAESLKLSRDELLEKVISDFLKYNS